MFRFSIHDMRIKVCLYNGICTHVITNVQEQQLIATAMCCSAGTSWHIQMQKFRPGSFNVPKSRHIQIQRFRRGKFMHTPIKSCASAQGCGKFNVPKGSHTQYKCLGTATVMSLQGRHIQAIRQSIFDVPKGRHIACDVCY